MLRLTLSEKLEVIKALDSEVIELTEDEEALATDIEQADGYKETVYSALIKIDRVIKSSSSAGTPPQLCPLALKPCPLTPTRAT